MSKKVSNNKSFLQCAATALLAMIFCLGFSFQHAFQLMGDELHDQHVAKNVEDHPAMFAHKIGTEPLEHEEMFINTLKSCLPSEKGESCKTFVPDMTERIGILAPPGQTATSLLNLINSVLAHGKRKEGAKFTKLEIIPTTHMAPYGYGKTHGYTRLIRVVPQPLLVGVTDTLLAAVQEMEEGNPNFHGVVTLDNVKASLRQQMRYHCRLNHISAHTALWTIGLEDMAETQMDDLIDMIQEFLELERDDSVVEKVMDEEMTRKYEPKLDEMFAKGAQILSLVQATNPGQNILHILDEVLLDEMRISNNLTAWPCESFWTVGESNDRLELGPTITFISQAMSPNCTSPFTSCFVKRDKCEYSGDGNCS